MISERISSSNLRDNLFTGIRAALGSRLRLLSRMLALPTFLGPVLTKQFSLRHHRALQISSDAGEIIRLHFHRHLITIVQKTSLAGTCRSGNLERTIRSTVDLKAGRRRA